MCVMRAAGQEELKQSHSESRAAASNPLIQQHTVIPPHPHNTHTPPHTLTQTGRQAHPRTPLGSQSLISQRTAPHCKTISLSSWRGTLGAIHYDLRFETFTFSSRNAGVELR